MSKQLTKIKTLNKFLVKNPENDPECMDDILAEFVKPKGTTLFGIELELGFTDEDGFKQFVRDKLGNTVAIHHDSGALEIDSPPLSYSDAHKYLDLLLGENNPYGTKDQGENWGMHIHVSKETCMGQHLKRVLKMLSDTSDSDKKLLTKLAGRSVSKGYGNIPGPKYYLGKSSDPIEQYLYNFSKKKIIRQVKAADLIKLEKYSGHTYGVEINTEHNTHEFRLFRATAEPTRAKANLQMVKSFIEFNRKKGGSLQEWRKWIKTRKLIYPHLHLWMTQEKLLS